MIYRAFNIIIYHTRRYSV